MKFYFSDKNAFEAEIICSVLDSENIRYKVYSEEETSSIQYVGFMMTTCCVSELKYSIAINTSLDQWDFLNYLIRKEIKYAKKYQKQIDKLEKCLELSEENKKQAKKCKKKADNMVEVSGSFGIILNE